MDERGWVKLNKKIIDWEWFSSPSTLAVFVYLILSANYRDKKWEGRVIPRGSLITSGQKIADATGLSRRTVVKVLNRLVESEVIVKYDNNKYTHIFIRNYDRYQD